MTLGAPLAVRGTFRAGPAGADGAVGLPPAGVVWGTARLLLPRGIFYDLRLAARDDAPGAEVHVLEGARRFVLGDLYVSATTLEGTLRRGRAAPATVRLRFDARDDLGALFRSFRLGGSGILGRRRAG